ncbi:MAG: four helix bundle protein, partial [Ruminococcus sp.]|nr:four helix bundle protein [Ruminococcus sp.]
MEIQTNSPLRKKSRDFAIRIINLYKYIKTEKKEFTVTNQILRCGTSIGANIAESECAISKKDFLS